MMYVMYFYYYSSCLRLDVCVYVCMCVDILWARWAKLSRYLYQLASAPTLAVILLWGLLSPSAFSLLVAASSVLPLARGCYRAEERETSFIHAPYESSLHAVNQLHNQSYLYY